MKHVDGGACLPLETVFAGITGGGCTSLSLSARHTGGVRKVVGAEVAHILYFSRSLRLRRN